MYRALCRWTKKTGLFYSHVTPLAHHLLMIMCVRVYVREKERERLYVCTSVSGGWSYSTNQEVLKSLRACKTTCASTSIFFCLFKLTITLRHNAVWGGGWEKQCIFMPLTVGERVMSSCCANNSLFLSHQNLMNCCISDSNEG